MKGCSKSILTGSACVGGMGEDVHIVPVRGKPRHIASIDSFRGCTNSRGYAVKDMAPK